MSRVSARAIRLIAAPSIHAAGGDPTHAPNDNDDGPTRIDYQPLREAARTAITWLLGIARSRAPELDDQAAVDRFERATLATIDGIPWCCRPADLRASQEDVLVVAAILIETFSIDFRLPGLRQLFGVLFSNLDWILRQTVVDRPPPTTVGHAGHAGHATQRHDDRIRVVQGLIERFVRGPRIAHGVDDDRPTTRGRFPAR